MPYDDEGYYEDDNSDWDEEDYYYAWSDWDYAQNYSFKDILTNGWWSRRLRARLIAVKIIIKISYVRRAARHTYLDAYYKITGKHDPRQDIPF